MRRIKKESEWPIQGPFRILSARFPGGKLGSMIVGIESLNDTKGSNILLSTYERNKAEFLFDLVVAEWERTTKRFKPTIHVEEFSTDGTGYGNDLLTREFIHFTDSETKEECISCGTEIVTGWQDIYTNICYCDDCVILKEFTKVEYNDKTRNF